MKKTIYNTIIFILSIIFSYLVSNRIIVGDLDSNTYYGFYLFILCFIGLVFVLSINAVYKKLLGLVNNSLKTVNITFFSLISLFFILAIFNLARMFSFVKVSYSSEKWSQTLELLLYQNKLFVIISYVLLFVSSLVYLYIYLSKIKKNSTTKSMIKSFGYSVLGLVVFGLIVLAIRVLFYTILIFTVGISVG